MLLKVSLNMLVSDNIRACVSEKLSMQMYEKIANAFTNPTQVMMLK